MTTTRHHSAPPVPDRRQAASVAAAARRFGYVVAAAVNAVVLYIANNLLTWEWPRFLTADFDRVLPLLNVSIIATIAVTLAYLAFDAGWFKSATQIALSCISIAVLARTLAIFPFDFSRYDFGWEPIARIVLILGIVGTGIAVVVNVAKLATGRAAAPRR